MQDNTMPQAVAKANYVRIAPRKVQIVLDLIRNQPADKALHSFPTRRSSDLTSNLYISECTVGQGPTLKRIRARAQGRAFRINKKTSHITLVLKEAE